MGGKLGKTQNTYVVSHAEKGPGGSEGAEDNIEERRYSYSHSELNYSGGAHSQP